MLTAASETSVEKVAAELLCESCGAEFFCGAKLGQCWCFSLEIKPQILTELRGKFNNCLCEVCLKRRQAQDISEQNNLAANESIDARR